MVGFWSGIYGRRSFANSIFTPSGQVIVGRGNAVQVGLVLLFDINVRSPSDNAEQPVYQEARTMTLYAVQQRIPRGFSSISGPRSRSLASSHDPLGPISSMSGNYGRSFGNSILTGLLGGIPSIDGTHLTAGDRWTFTYNYTSPLSVENGIYTVTAGRWDEAPPPIMTIEIGDDDVT